MAFIARLRSWRGNWASAWRPRTSRSSTTARCPGLFGTSPFDDEGVPSRRTVVIDRGVLQSYLLNTLHCAEAGASHHRQRGARHHRKRGRGPREFFSAKGPALRPKRSFAEFAADLYVTELIGHGVNIVTGDYSRGAAGLWIENGEFAYPVSEITIAANLQQMLMDVEAAGIRSGISRIGGIADAADPGDDRQWAVKLAIVTSCSRSRWLLAGGLLWFFNRPKPRPRSAPLYRPTPKLTFAICSSAT